MIEILEHNEIGFKRLVEYGAWTAAVLNDHPRYSVEGVSYLQKHDLSDEVFILLQGECTLFVAGQGDCPEEIVAVPMEPLKFYNIKAGVWHTHVLSPDTKVVVVENSDTCLDNSPISDLTPAQKERILELLQ